MKSVDIVELTKAQIEEKRQKKVKKKRFHVNYIRKTKCDKISKKVEHKKKF